MSYLLKLIHKPLSDDDLRRVLGDDLKILKYSDLVNYNDLDELYRIELITASYSTKKGSIQVIGSACANTMGSLNILIPMALSQIVR